VFVTQHHTRYHDTRLTFKEEGLSFIIEPYEGLPRNLKQWRAWLDSQPMIILGGPATLTIMAAYAIDPRQQFCRVCMSARLAAGHCRLPWARLSVVREMIGSPSI
jgi:hypothetical protein